jgi:hypothetical protein
MGQKKYQEFRLEIEAVNSVSNGKEASINSPMSGILCAIIYYSTLQL